jgi:hypothetical protein
MTKQQINDVVVLVRSWFGIKVSLIQIDASREARFQTRPVRGWRLCLELNSGVEKPGVSWS